MCSHARIRLVAVAEHFPAQDAKRPNVAFSCILSVIDTLRSHPLDGNFVFTCLAVVVGGLESARKPDITQFHSERRVECNKDVSVERKEIEANQKGKQ